MRKSASFFKCLPVLSGQYFSHCDSTIALSVPLDRPGIRLVPLAPLGERLRNPKAGVDVSPLQMSSETIQVGGSLADTVIGHVGGLVHPLLAFSEGVVSDHHRRDACIVEEIECLHENVARPEVALLARRVAFLCVRTDSCGHLAE